MMAVYGGAKEAKLELLVNDLIAKIKSTPAIVTYFEVNKFLAKNKIA